mmetsp:Transcript_45701/g.67481  ORF Transcript_45701/g.67481 Transcript_45701/m.67481 type:complete len:227 (-) Transcript_45701:198-878(-)
MNAVCLKVAPTVGHLALLSSSFTCAIMLILVSCSISSRSSSVKSPNALSSPTPPVMMASRLRDCSASAPAGTDPNASGEDEGSSLAMARALASSIALAVATDFSMSRLDARARIRSRIESYSVFFDSNLLTCSSVRPPPLFSARMASSSSLNLTDASSNETLFASSSSLFAYNCVIGRATNVVIDRYCCGRVLHGTRGTIENEFTEELHRSKETAKFTVYIMYILL